jgi:diacylglycerol kinase family enzyme
MIAFVIVNPCAAAADPRHQDALLRTLREVACVDVMNTTGRGHATSVARDVMRQRSADVVVAVGGDGTINEVTNGLLTDGAHSYIPALGVLPTGGTNVFARSLGIPNDPWTAIADLRESLASGERRVINVGQVNDRYFAFCAGIGLDAAIIARIEKLRGQGRRSSLSLAVAATAGQLFAGTQPTMQLKLPSTAPVTGLRWVIVANSDPWTFINSRPLRPTPCASFELGMDIYARRNMMPFKLLWAALQMSRRAPRFKGKGIYRNHDIWQFAIEAEEAVPIQVDGDLLGHPHRLEFRTIHQALAIAAPSSRR